MTWWCSSVDWPWTWSWRPYVGAWVLVAAIGVPYLLAMRARARTVGLTDGDRRAAIWFGLGLASVWLASDWPIAALGASYYLSAHTAQFVLYAMIAAPLLLIGMPDWLARSALDRTRTFTSYRALSNIWVAALVYNGVLIATHVPSVLDGLRTSQIGSFGLDLLWLLSGVLVWTPVVSTLGELRLKGAISRCVYLFVATGVFPMVPAALITFSPVPLYRTYELAPRAGGMSVLADQQLAGAAMKVSGVFITFPVIAYIFIKAALVESRSVTEPVAAPDCSSASRDARDEGARWS